MKINADMLRGFLDCMHEEADGRDKRSEAIRDIVKAAKEKGYDTKAIRKVFARERMDEGERSKQDELLETYEHALGGKGRALAAIAAGVPVGEAAKANGVHRATVARARHVANEPSNATARKMVADDLGKPYLPNCGASNRMGDDCSYPNCDCHDGVPSGRDEPSDEHSTSTTGEGHGRDSAEAGVPAIGELARRGAGECGSGREGGAGVLRLRGGQDGGDDGRPQSETPQEVGAGDTRPKGTTESDDLAIPHFLRSPSPPSIGGGMRYE